jgi:hypothetical protein
MNSEIVIHLLINLIIVGILIYIYKSNKKFFIVSILIILLIVFLIPDFLLPSKVWELLLKD